MIWAEPEGATPISPDERRGLRFAHITTREELDELEQANIEQGLAWVRRRRSGSIFDDTFVRRLHWRLFGDVWDWAGTYRRTGTNIGIDPWEIAVQLRILLDDAAYWAEHRAHPALEAAARFHHRMVQIHPFPDGNGRLARIATDIMVEEVYGCSPVDWTGDLDPQAVSARRTSYIAALRAADRGDLVPLFEFVGMPAGAG